MTLLPKPSFLSAARPYQLLQMEHDRVYHRDIDNLPPPRKMFHFTLHLMKYLGRLAELPTLTEGKPLIDALIILVAAGNTLNLDLTDSFAGSFPYGDFFRDFGSGLGRLAKACEAVDHTEKFPFRAEMEAAVQDLLRVVLSGFFREGWDPGRLFEAYRARLEAVERAHPLYAILSSGVSP